MRVKTSTVLGICVLCTSALIYGLGAKNMPQVKFDIGRNILETARQSGAPRYTTGNVAGVVSYELVNLPPDIPAFYQRQGYEITASPLFALTLYANEESNDGLAVQTAALQFSKDAAKSHEAAQTFVADLIAQFRKGKWKRHIDELCPAVTGRSAFLNTAGKPERTGFCPLDPQYTLTSEDWIVLMGKTQNYQWTGDGVLATLTIGYSDDIRGITYSIDLEFEDLETVNLREKRNLLRELAEGDAQGWNSTAIHSEEILERKALLKVLEENAQRRGDRIIPR